VSEEGAAQLIEQLVLSTPAEAERNARRLADEAARAMAVSASAASAPVPSPARQGAA
jgi:hypothetical protein